ncbi:MAG: YceD family protein [Weeksellaceae bacterium]
MEKIRNYDVSFFGLRDGKHTFEFDISQAFFDLFTFEQEFEKPEIYVDLELVKKTTFLELHFKMRGDIELSCDISNRLYRQPIEGELDMVVKFGHQFDDSDDEVWEIPQGENRINVAQLIYELVLLNIPIKHYHPDLESEEAEEALHLLDEYAPKAIDEAEEQDESEEDIDPRWDSLKKLL